MIVKKCTMLDYLQTLGMSIDMKNEQYIFTLSTDSIIPSGSDIKSLHLLHTMEIEPWDEQRNRTPYHLYQYYQKFKNSHLQEAPMNYITQIRNLREDSDKTQQEIADFLGTSQTMYARYERGANEMPIRHLIRLAQFYNVSLDYLCGLTTIKRPYPTI